jgi:tetratricopeptide (TPR) repeat protein
MPDTIDLSLEYLKRLPAREDVWQLGIERAPQWIVEEGKPPVRPLMTVCRSARTGMVAPGVLVPPGEDLESAALNAVISLSRLKGVEFRPQRVEFRDRRVEQALRPILEEAGIDLRFNPQLDLVDEFLREMAEEFGGPLGAHSAFAPEIDLKQMLGFAEAAALLYRRALWNDLDSNDLVRVLRPAPAPGMGWFTVLGAGGQEYGLGFHLSPEEHQDVLQDKLPQDLHTESRWVFSFEPIYNLPLRDSEFWEKHDLPVAGPSAYPLVIHAAPSSPVRPVRGQGRWAHRESREFLPVLTEELNFLEWLLRALAETTEDELDSGRWSKIVMVRGRGRKVELSIPALLEPPRPFKPGMPFDRRIVEPPPPALTPEDKALELFSQALEAVGRRRIKLAREAIRLWPDCADAWMLLAEEMPDAARRMEFYGSALEAAKRALGPRPFTEDVGTFWGTIETRTYTRVLWGQAESFWQMGRREEAVAGFRELLRLDEEDNQGVRYLLLPRLLALKKDDEALEFLTTLEGDPTAVVAFTRALVTFRRQGSGAAADNFLRAAVRANPHVLKYLLGNEEVPYDLPDSYELGGEDEAILLAAELVSPWQATPKAVEWLRTFRRGKKKAKAAKKRR